MQAVSKKYKQEMKKRYRDECSYIRVTIGLINQSAQANAKVKDAAAFTYFSALEKPFELPGAGVVCDLRRRLVCS